MLKRIFLLLWVMVYMGEASAQPDTVRFSVDASTPNLVLPKFWRATGYSPASKTLEAPMKATFNHLDAIPQKGIEYVRPHYLLKHIKGRKLGTIEQELDFSGLDSILDVFMANNQKPIFQLMGNPENAWTDWYDSTKLIAWKNLVRDMVNHYQDRFGDEEVRSWFFETVNEPEYPTWWPHGVLDFLNYYDASAQGLAEADPKLRFGGPGSAKYYGFMWRVLLEHAHHGYNWFGGRGARLDFISVHRKAFPHKMVEEESNMLQHVRDHFPKFDSVAWWNDEADPMIGWSKPLWWRSGPWYAAFVAQSVDLHARHLMDSLGAVYGMLSNDNGFLGNWGQRSLLAQFVNDPAIPKGDPRFFLVKKPVYSVMSLLALLGEKRYPVHIHSPERPHLGVIPTSIDGTHYAVLLYHKGGITRRQLQNGGEIAGEAIQDTLKKQEAVLGLNMGNLTPGTYTLVHHRLDDVNGHAFRLWQASGSPQQPSSQLMQQLQAAQEPVLIECKNIDIDPGDKSLSLELPMPASAVSLVRLLKKPAGSPKAITDLRLSSYTGLHGNPMSMLNWEDPVNPFVKTYEVQYAEPGENEFNRINPVDLIEQGFLHLKDQKGGRYRVRAVDFWKRKSPWVNLDGS